MGIQKLNRNSKDREEGDIRENENEVQAFSTSTPTLKRKPKTGTCERETVKSFFPETEEICIFSRGRRENETDENHTGRFE